MEREKKERERARERIKKNSATRQKKEKWDEAKRVTNSRPRVYPHLAAVRNGKMKNKSAVVLL